MKFTESTVEDAALAWLGDALAKRLRVRPTGRFT